MPYLIGIDLGTSSAKGAMFDERGTLKAQASREIALVRKEATAEQDPFEFLEATLDIIHELVTVSEVPKGSVAGICLDGQMGGALAVDSDLEPLTPWHPSSLDTRYLPFQQRIYDLYNEEEVIALSGSQPILGAWLLKWRETPVWQKLDKVMLLANWVAGRLVGHKGEDAFTDASYLTWTGITDTKARAWSTEVLEGLELEPHLLPKVVAASDIVGTITGEVARRTGLSQGTPVVAGVGDQVAGFIGAGVVQPGQLIDVSGTFPVFSVCLEQYLPDPSHKMLKPLAAPGDLWYSMMYISGGGLTHNWLRGLLAEGDDAFAELVETASSLSPGADALLAVPHFLGRSCPEDADMRGAFLGLSWHHDKAHLYRALLESVAYDYAQALAILRRQLPDPSFEAVTVIGGGAKNGLWNQIKSDMLGLPYKTLEVDLATPLGAAIIAGYGVGLFDELASTAQDFARRRQQPDATVVDWDNHERYRPFVRAYGEALAALEPVHQALAEARET